ncbi:glyoxalase domain-containing protein 5 [Halteromyces radiatus]|uniref:glyoxalase domain-containing protein 5 n=1 Tax=Halteromyces radiatus TaxID=101107 RepID=UPI00221E7C57|nr:glyoxalase domain-containing protein 5 [Halteromyces radiatus]KAI8078783.1 glyoxalase domain-containing protein 5 [Halteromyces radiatus]
MKPIIKGIDHVVINVSNMAKSCQWYETMLGMKAHIFTSPSDPSKKRYALHFGDQKINLHETGGDKVIPIAQHPQLGSTDLCLWTDQPVQSILEHWQQHHHQFSSEGPLVLENHLSVVKRTGATGELTSIYIYDLDGNLIEVANRTNG